MKINQQEDVISSIKYNEKEIEALKEQVKGLEKLVGKQRKELELREDKEIVTKIKKLEEQINIEKGKYRELYE